MPAVEQGGRSKQARKRWATGLRPPSPFIAREGQPASPTIAGNDGFPCMSQGLFQSSSCRGSVGKRRRPRPINRHASTEATCFWGPRCSELDPWLRREAKPERTLGLGATVGVLGTRVPRLACLRPTAWLSSRSYGPSSSTRHPRPSRGAKPREADDARPPLEWPSRAGSRGAEISRQGKPHEALVT